MKGMSLRAPEGWYTDVDALQELLGDFEAENRSRLIRELIQREHLLLARAPYVATQADYFVFVDSSGDMYLHAREKLRFLAERRRLPHRISMKPEKEVEYERELTGDPLMGEKLRSKWLVHYVLAHNGDPEQPRAAGSDELGITSKSVDIEVGQAPHAECIREVVVGNENYVLRSEEHETTLDRASLTLGVPTMNLTAAVIADLGLFGPAEGRRHTPTLSYDLRNGDLARFPERTYSTESNSIDWHTGEFLGYTTRFEAHRRETLGYFERFQSRLRLVAGEQPPPGLDEPCVPEREVRQKLLSVKEPKEYLFGLFKWPLPPVGLTLSLTWNRPPKR